MPLEPHQFRDRGDVLVDIHRGHAHAPRRGVEALGIAVRPEQVDVAVGAPVGLGAVEDHLAVVVDGRGRVQGQRPVGLDACVVPAALAVVAPREHARGEVATEAQGLGQGHGCVGQGLDVDVHGLVVNP